MKLNENPPGISETSVRIVLTKFSMGDNINKTFFCNKISLKRIKVFRRY